jgi:hypothetical protein
MRIPITQAYSNKRWRKTVHPYLLFRQFKKHPFWLVVPCIAMITLLIGGTTARAASPWPVTHTKSRHIRPFTVLPLTPRAASRGNPLDIALDAGQDVSLPSDQADDAGQDFTTASLQDNLAGQGIRVHHGFTSISLETFHVCNDSYPPTQTTMRNLLKNFGSHGIIRIGGGSVDSTGWDGQSTRTCPQSGLEEVDTITRPMIQQMFSFAHSVGWKVLWSIGIQLTPEQVADEAAAAVSISNSIDPGSNSPLLAIAIGNEPELDLMDGNATYQQFRTQWETDARAIKARVPAVKLFGPDTCCTDNDQWFKSFVKDDGKQIQVATNHLYPDWADDTHTPTIAEILSPDLMQSSMETIDSLHEAAAAQHLPLLMSETNSIANSPPPAVGSSFGQSLWTADYLFNALEHKVLALNFHGGVPGDATSPFDGNGNTLTVQSTYYGMLFFYQAVAEGGHTVSLKSVTGNNGLNVTIHAIRGRDGKLYVALINKGGQDANMRINSGRILPQRAQAIRLSAPSVEAQNGFQLGGTSINADGTWSARQVETVPVSQNVASLAVPGYSAALITFQPAL